MINAYDQFLATKHVVAPRHGIDAPHDISERLFRFQRDIVRWALRRGRAAVFAERGLGKTAIQLEWARHVAEHTRLPVLVLAPLAVARQTQSEGVKFGIDVTVCESQKDVVQGVNVTNYEKLAKFDTRAFGGVVLDESSILKSYMGKTKRALIDAFAHTPFRLCCTATPSPNDQMEIGNHSEFLGIMPAPEMLSRWFINDTMATGHYRLKGHAEAPFWKWVSSWALSLRKPSDLGDYSDDGYILPPLRIEFVRVEVDVQADREEGALFRDPSLSATTMHQELRRTASDRAAAVADLLRQEPHEPWIVWCNTNYEADELLKVLPDAVEIRGSESIRVKEDKIAAFIDGRARVLIGKPSMLGYGLNLQHCARVAFVGLSYSFEQYYQAMGRTHRFGQMREVRAYIVGAQTEGAFASTIERKTREHERMLDELVRYSRNAHTEQSSTLELTMVKSGRTESGSDWTMRLGDSCELIRQQSDASVHFSIFSPPFSGLYIYSDAAQDMGNSADDEEFFRHFEYLIPELHRITVPGRLCAVHCKQLVNYKGRDGMAGLRDFRGDIIRSFTKFGWAYHSEVCIWKDPVVEMQRTKAHGLLYKQLRADSSFSRNGMAEYLLVFRRWAKSGADEALIQPVTHTTEDFSLELWQRYASPVWMDIRQTNVLNVQIAREDRDEKHICPLQLDVIERALRLWSNPGDLIFSPFAGIGSEGFVVLQEGRRFLGFELKQSYFEQACRNLEIASRRSRDQLTLLEAAR